MSDNHQSSATNESSDSQTAAYEARKASRAQRATKGSLNFREKAVVFGFFALWLLCVYSCAGGKI